MATATGKLVWTDDIADLNDVDAYTTTTSGNYVSVTGALDDIFPFNELEEYTDSSGNKFIRFPKMYIKWVDEDDGTIDGIKVSRYQADEDFFIPDCFLSPDGASYNDYFYMGRYDGSGDSTLVYSVSGATPLVNLTRADFRAGCRGYGSSSNQYNGYQQLDIQMLTLYNFLCMLFYRTQNIQTVYGGRTGYISTWSAASVTGTTDDVDGLNGWNTSTECVKMLGVENPYGNVFKNCDGICFVYNTVYAKRLAINFGNTTSDIDMGFTRTTSSGYIKALKHGTSDETRSTVYCSSTGSSSSTYCGDYCTFGAFSSTNTTYIYLVVGGSYSNATTSGLWYLDGNRTSNDSVSTVNGSYVYLTGKDAYTGCRLCMRPVNES